jgi:hypothetical protein
MPKKRVIGLGLLAALALYMGRGALWHWVLPDTRVTITWPGDWACDEYQESYKVVKVEYPNILVRWLYKDHPRIVPYPAGRYGDTTAFYRYYHQQVKDGRNDTVVVRGRFGYEIGVGERGVLYQCDDIPYIEVRTIYSIRGKVLKQFKLAPH